MSIELRGVRRYFRDVKAVDDVSFRVDPGTVCGFIGPNGAGKTTAMRILATLDSPQGGDAIVCGHSVTDYPDRVRARLGYMPDYLGTYSQMTVWEYLDFFSRTYGLHGARRRDRVESVLDFTDLTTLAERDVTALSKGMMQRLSLARALVNDPAVLILDEPAAGLDPRARLELLELIRELGAGGKTILISSHILAELSRICDYVVIIDRGRIKLTGTAAEVREHVRNGRFRPPSRDGAPPQPAACRVIVTFTDVVADAERILLEQPGVQDVRLTGHEALVHHVGGPASLAAVLKGLVDAGLPVVSFTPQEEGLEEVFMAVTERGFE